MKSDDAYGEMVLALEEEVRWLDSINKSLKYTVNNLGEKVEKIRYYSTKQKSIVRVGIFTGIKFGFAFTVALLVASFIISPSSGLNNFLGWVFSFTSDVFDYLSQINEIADILKKFENSAVSGVWGEQFDIEVFLSSVKFEVVIVKDGRIVDFTTLTGYSVLENYLQKYDVYSSNLRCKGFPLSDHSLVLFYMDKCRGKDTDTITFSGYSRFREYFASVTVYFPPCN